jgi:hypothetical protein
MRSLTLLRLHHERRLRDPGDLAAILVTPGTIEAGLLCIFALLGPESA